MSDPLRLRVRTPEGLLYDDLVSSIRAEDRDGWFGILPGRRDVLATLPPGLLLFADAEGDGFVALSGGLLALRGGECRVMASEARLARDPVRAADAPAGSRARRRERAARRRDVMADLEREAIGRMARALREAP